MQFQGCTPVWGRISPVILGRECTPKSKEKAPPPPPPRAYTATHPKPLIL